MLNFVIFGIIVAVIYLLLFRIKEGGYYGFDFSEWVMFGLFSSVFSSATIGAIFGLTLWLTDIKQTSPQQHEIYSLERDKDVEGRFFILGSGYINSKPTYVCFVGNDVEGYRMKTLPAENTLLIQSDEKPYYEETNDMYDQWFMRFMFYGKNFSAPIVVMKENVTKINIPKNSIIKQYKP